MKYKSLEITEEEKEALKEYCEWNYAYINLLTSGDIDAISKFNNDRLDIFSKEYFEKSMETLKKIYSAMVKYSYMNKDGLGTLIRGTTVAEVETFKGEYTKMLSTSMSEESAKEHAGSKVKNGYAKGNDKKPAIIRIKVSDEDLPFINVNRVLGDESNHSREQEILLAPFGIFDKTQKVSEWNGCEYYSTTIESQVLEKIDNLDDIRESVFDNIAKIPEIIKEYNICNNKLETVNSYLERPQMQEDRADLLQTQQELYEKMPRIKEQFNSIRQSMVQYAKGICCEQRENVYENVEKEEEAIRAETQTIQENTTRSVRQYTDIVRECVKNLKIKTDKYKITASKIGLEWDVGISNELLENAIINMQNQIGEMNSKLVDDMSKKTISFQEGTIKNYLQKAEIIRKMAEEIQKREAEYNDKAYAEKIKSALNKRIDKLIAQNDVIKLEQEMANLDEQKTGFLDNILGKSKERTLKRQQLVLKKQLIEMKPIKEEENCSAHEMMAKIIKYKQKNNGVLPRELQTIAEQMRTVFKIDDNRISEILNDMTAPLDIVPVEEKTSIFNRRKSISRLQEQNAKLAEDVKIIRRQDTFIHFESKDKSVCDIPQDIYNQIQNISSVTIERNRNVKQL